MHDDPEMLGLLMESYFIPSGYFEKLEYFRKNGKINIEGKFIIETMLDSLLFFPHMARSAMEKHIGKENIEEFFESNVEAVLTVFEKGLYR